MFLNTNVSDRQIGCIQRTYFHLLQASPKYGCRDKNLALHSRRYTLAALPGQYCNDAAWKQYSSIGFCFHYTNVEPAQTFIPLSGTYLEISPKI